MYSWRHALHPPKAAVPFMFQLETVHSFQKASFRAAWERGCDTLDMHKILCAMHPLHENQSIHSSLHFPSGQTLLIDADDTLWENNLYFEKAIAGFIQHLNHQHYSHDEVRAFLNRVEKESIQERGYGLHSFRHSLLLCFESLSEEPLTPEREQEIIRFTHVVENHAIEFLPGVVETLPLLATQHQLILVTKGNFEEQTAKVGRSGLSTHFAAVEVPAEKTPESYRNIVEKYQLNLAATWMIGNSPKSDINPALEAGLHAIFLAHPNTWVLEHEEVHTTPPGQHCLWLEGFAELAKVFS